MGRCCPTVPILLVSYLEQLFEAMSASTTLIDRYDPRFRFMLDDFDEDSSTGDAIDGVITQYNKKVETAKAAIQAWVSAGNNEESVPLIRCTSSDS